MNKVIAFLFVVLIVCGGECPAQNLFPNPDFEQYNVMPSTYSGINTGDCVGWTCIAGSPDYYNTSFYGFSGNPAGLPSSGTGLVGMWGLPNNLFCNGALQRESMMGNLITPLEKCRRYRVSFDLRLQQVGSTSTPGYGPGCIDFGFYFYSGADPNTCANSCGCWNVTPQVAVHGDQVPLVTYMTFTYEFIASDNFDKVAIGPFCSDTMFSASCYDTPSNNGSFAMYFNLDNISIIKIDDIDLTMTDTSICQGQSITFTGSSLDTALSWNWSIPNAVQTYAGGDSVVYYFPDAGSYDISIATLTACGSGGGYYPGAINVHPAYNDVEIDSSLLTCTSLAYTIPGNHSSLNYSWSDSVAGSTRFFAAPGIYTVHVTDQYGCHSSSDTIDVNLLDSFLIFPNPTNRIWMSDYAMQSPNHITLHDDRGRIILSEGDVSQIKIDAAEYHLASGMYFLDVTISDCTKTIKLMLVR